jgi:uracil-DNA glycosylase
VSGDQTLARAALRERLEWLRDLGVDALRRTPATPAADAATAARRAEGEPRSLFETDEPHEAEPSRHRGRPLGGGSPLLSLGEPSKAPAAEALEALRAEIGADCRRCRLCEKRTRVVFGVGDAAARLMFVGEGPGADEDAQGEPFVGRAGQLLNKIIEAIGLRREQVYIANVVKCRPPENRTPLPDEMEICGQFLFRQLLVLQPKAICVLGSTAAKALLGTKEGITRLRGNWQRWRDIPVLPTYHPSFLLRPYNQNAKREAWEDLKKVLHAVYD